MGEWLTKHFVGHGGSQWDQSSAVHANVEVMVRVVVSIVSEVDVVQATSFHIAVLRTSQLGRCSLEDEEGQVAFSLHLNQLDSDGSLRIGSGELVVAPLVLSNRALHEVFRVDSNQG